MEKTKLNNMQIDLPLYEAGKPLKEDEYLLKLRDDDSGNPLTGFMTKLTKKGVFPIAFEHWPERWFRIEPEHPVYVINETYRPGWKLRAWRFGMSQNWATLIHPLGFTVEIYLDQMLELVKSEIIINGGLVGYFKWEDKKLIKCPLYRMQYA